MLPHQRREVTRLLSQAAVTADHMVGTPGDEELGAVTGSRQPSYDAVPEADFRAVIADRKARPLDVEEDLLLGHEFCGGDGALPVS